LPWTAWTRIETEFHHLPRRPLANERPSSNSGHSDARNGKSRGMWNYGIMVNEWQGWWAWRRGGYRTETDNSWAVRK
jgi:hypothetical protein